METICLETCRGCLKLFHACWSCGWKSLSMMCSVAHSVLRRWQVASRRAATHPEAFTQPSISWQPQCGTKNASAPPSSSSAASSGWTNQAVALTDRMEISERVFLCRRSFRVQHYAWRIPKRAPRALSRCVFIKPLAAQSEVTMSQDANNRNMKRGI